MKKKHVFDFLIKKYNANRRFWDKMKVGPYLFKLKSIKFDVIILEFSRTAFLYEGAHFSLSKYSKVVIPNLFYFYYILK